VGKIAAAAERLTQTSRAILPTRGQSPHAPRGQIAANASPDFWLPCQAICPRRLERGGDQAGYGDEALAQDRNIGAP
jgi:hypothetical protein